MNEEISNQRSTKNGICSKIWALAFKRKADPSRTQKSHELHRFADFACAYLVREPKQAGMYSPVMRGILRARPVESFRVDGVHTVIFPVGGD